MNIDRETAREHFCILYDALYSFNGSGGNLHALTDDDNDDETIKRLNEEWLPSRKDETPDAQWAVERALLDLFMKFNEKDRDYILHGTDI